MEDPTTEFGVIDYRKKDCVNVVDDSENEEMAIVTLRFYFRVTGDNEKVTDEKARDICKDWCAKWDPEKIGKDFNDIYEVEWSKWLEPTVFQMKIKKPPHYCYDGVSSSADEIYENFVYDCLEDTFYEGGTEDNFWCLPMSEA